MARSFQSLSGKTALVTGATSGIGEAIAVGLARLGAQVAITARNEGKGRPVVERVQREVPGAQVELFLCDFAVQSSIRALADEVNRRLPRLDILVNNAGAMHTQREVTPDGLEMTFAVNHLGYFLLTNLLLDKLKHSAPARIISTASGAHWGGKLNWEDLQSERGYSSFKVYSTSKLANILFTRELARRLQGSGVTANCFHPGVVTTGFAKNDPGFLNVVFQLLGPFLRKPAKAAETVLYLASAPELADVSGKYFYNLSEARTSGAAKSDPDAQRLWTESARLTQLAVA